MRSCSLVSWRPFGLVLLAVVAAGPVVLAACREPGNAVADAAPAATVIAPVATSAVVTATVSAVPLAPLAPLGGTTPANPGTPGTPGHPRPGHADGGGGPAGSATPNAGGLPFILPSNLPPLPSNLTLPTAFPSNLTIPSGLPQIVPPSSSTH